MTSFDTGRQAEAAAADYLRTKRYAIVQQNWRTKWCEIDIVAQQGGVVYFCEVKYRQTGNQGGGLEYITPRKLQQMRLAAEGWVHLTGWAGECQLCAIEVSGDDFVVTAFIDDI